MYTRDPEKSRKVTKQLCALIARLQVLANQRDVPIAARGFAGRPAETRGNETSADLKADQVGEVGLAAAANSTILALARDHI